MATSPVPEWAREMSPTHRGPTAGGVLWLAVLAVILVIVLQAWPSSSRSEDKWSERPPPPCATVWPPTCDQAKAP
jgi:hypothetical protein